MNAINQPDYRDSMQAAALAFLRRHHAEHLTGDDALFDRAIRYLVQALDVPIFMAPRLVHLAMSELQPKRFVGVDLAAGIDSCSLVLVDGRTGERVVIPRRILPSRFLPSTTL